CLATQPGDAANDLVAENVGSTTHTGLLMHVTAADTRGFHLQQASVRGDVRHGVCPDLEGFRGDHRGRQYVLRHSATSLRESYVRPSACVPMSMAMIS